MARQRVGKRMCERKVRGKRMNREKNRKTVIKSEKRGVKGSDRWKAETKKSAHESALPRLILTVGQGA